MAAGGRNIAKVCDLCWAKILHRVREAFLARGRARTRTCQDNFVSHAESFCRSIFAKMMDYGKFKQQSLENVGGQSKIIGKTHLLAPLSWLCVRSRGLATYSEMAEIDYPYSSLLGHVLRTDRVIYLDVNASGITQHLQLMGFSLCITPTEEVVTFMSLWP